MDPVTQGALGAACAQSILYPHDKKNVWIAGALAGMAPDLDVVFQSSQDPMFFLLYHRQFTHSLFFIPIGSVLVFLFLLCFQRFRDKWPIILLACFIGYATHALLDTCTSYGTVILWPFSNQRLAWDMVSIIDPMITVPLVLGVVWTQVFKNRRGAFVGISIVVVFLCFNIFQHHRAKSVVWDYAKQQKMELKQLRLLPNLTSSTHWRAIGFSQHEVFIAAVHTPLLAHSELCDPLKLSAYRQQHLPDWIRSTGTLYRDYQIFNWFADGYLIAVNKDPLILVDARYLMGSPLTALWGIQFTRGEAHVSRVRNILIQK